MNKHFRSASARSFGESEDSNTDFSLENNSRPGIGFSRRETTDWLLFFGFVFFLLLIVLFAGRHFMFR